MARLVLLGVGALSLLAAPGCIVVSAADLAIDATGAAVGTAGDVVEGAVDVVTPGDKQAEASPKAVDHELEYHPDAR